MRWAVFETVDGERRREQRGLETEDAFIAMMEMSRTVFSFVRMRGKMHLQMTRTTPVPDLPFIDPVRDLEMLREMWPNFESNNVDDEITKREIMEKALRHGRDNIRAEIER